jgi:hypothetical protein
MIVVEPFEAANATDGSSMWFTPRLEIFVEVSEPEGKGFFTFADASFTARLDLIIAHCRLYYSTLAASQ